MPKKSKPRDWVRKTDDKGREFLIDKTTGEIKGIGFGMIEKSILIDIQKLIRKHPSAAEVLFYMTRIANTRNEIDLSQDEIATGGGFSRSKLQRAIVILGSANFILIERSGASNTYYINDRVFWQKSSADKSYISNHTGAIKLNKP